MGKRDKYNSLGYLDMTAYLAIRKIEREEAIKRKREENKRKQDKRRK